MQDNFQRLLDLYCSSYMIRLSRYAILLSCVFTLLAPKVSRICNTGVPRKMESANIRINNAILKLSAINFKLPYDKKGVVEVYSNFVMVFSSQYTNRL